ncbi:MAG: tetratricopeptide repeat protein [Myxococcota bacterium]|nr:tetratricopeptide repeat protein [Myxococcota bacterium]
MATGAAPPAPDLDEVRHLYDRGLYRQAWVLGTRDAALESWTGVGGRTLAGRLARHLGAVKLSRALFLLGYREARDDAESLYYYGQCVVERRGPLAAWRLLEAKGELPDAEPGIRADWLGFHATVLGLLRDFDRADAFLCRAEALAPDRPWVMIERAGLYFAADRPDEALRVARAALEQEPWYRPGVECVSTALVQLGRDDEALALLREASERLECARVTGQLLQLLLESERLEEAEAATDRLETLAPLLDRGGLVWLAGMRADIAYRRGDRQGAREAAARADDDFYRRFRERLAEPADAYRAVRLPVPYVRQDYLTCGPATLSAIGSYWSRPTPHDEIAGEICYEGTPDHVERHWAETHDWRAWEFRVDWDTTRALLDRGVPFTFTSVQPTQAHLQAVTGYDELRETLLVRDPSSYGIQEYQAEEFITCFRSMGPRGMVLVPPGEESRLEGLTLPDEAIYDGVYRIKRALEERQREHAEDHFQDLRRAHPDHPLTLRVACDLALYDGDAAAALGAVTALLDAFPRDPTLELRRVALLRRLGRHDEALHALDEITGRADVDAIFWQQYAELLRSDARRWTEAESWLARALRRRPADPHVYSTLASLRTAQGRLEEALELHRFAACLSPTDEAPSQEYFTATRICGRPEEGLEFLRRRSDRVAQQSSLPARTLSWALAQLERRSEALEVLDDAMRARPDDAELRLAAALELARAGRGERARELLEASRGGVTRAAWLRAAAELAGQRGRSAEALSLWRELCEVSPPDEALVEEVARLIALTEGSEQVTAFLNGAAERAPRNLEIGILRAHWLASRRDDAALPAARELTRLHPASAPAHQALAEALLSHRQLDEAEAAARRAIERDPLSASAHALLGRVLMTGGDNEAAAACFETAVRRDVDSAGAIESLVACHDTDTARRRALAVVEEELRRQVVFGAGLAAFRAAARAVLEPDEVARLLRQALEARPDLWQGWAESVRQLCAMDRLDEALSLAETATERFPLVAEAWSDVATVHQLRSDRPRRREALEQALAVAPSWSWAHRELGLLLREEGRLEEARERIERGLACAPLEAANHGCLADVWWALGDREAALACLRQALRLDPDYGWGWQQLREWGAELGRTDENRKLADALVAERPDDIRCCLAVARENPEPERLQERLRALTAAAELEPHNTEVHDQRAAELAAAGRFEEALAACRPAAFGAVVPIELRGRAAWIEAQRGRHDAARRQMEALVAEQPGYTWGWWQLSLWAADAQDVDRALENIRSLLRVSPGNAEAWWLLGRMERQRGARDAARDALSRTLDVEPYKYGAGLDLVEIAIEDADLDGATLHLDRIAPYAPRDEVLVRQLEIAARRGDREDAAACFDALCDAEGSDPEPLERAARLLAGFGWKQDTARVLDAKIEGGAAGARVLQLFAQRCAEMPRRWRESESALLAACAPDEAGTAGLSRYVEALAHARRKRRLDALVRAHASRFGGDVVLWAMVGYAYVTLSRERETVGWLADWREREDVKPWMLLNLVVALRGLGRWEEAGEVGRHALALPPDHAEAEHASWCALDAALAGELAEARRLCDRAARLTDADFYGVVLSMIRLVIAASTEGPEGTRAYAVEKARLAASRRRMKADPTLWLAFRRCLDAVVRARPSRMARLRAAFGRVP